MAKQPISGHVKTRLCPPLTPDDAAAVALAMLDDTYRVAVNAACADVAFAAAPAEAVDWFRSRFPNCAVAAQQGADLGKRLENAFRWAWRMRYQPCAIIGSDSPDMPPLLLREAFEALRSGPDAPDAAIAPAEDGGFSLIALRRPIPGLFREIPWSTPNTLFALEANFDRAGARAVRLASWPDVDCPNDLVRLAGSPAAPHTAAAIAAAGAVATN